MKLFLFATLMLFSSFSSAEKLIVAAASDLRFALDDIITEYKRLHPEIDIEVIYGSSGKMTTQIINGAPYELFFSADIGYAQQLQTAGFSASKPKIYALGRIVLWSAAYNASSLTLADLADSKFKRIAIAQPTHAPYGLRTQEAMEAAGVWSQVKSKLVFAENIAQAAQMARSGAADIAVLALSLVKFPAFQSQGYYLIPEQLHSPLTQGYVITSNGKDNKEAHKFVQFMSTDSAYTIMKQYGFTVPH